MNNQQLQIKDRKIKSWTLLDRESQTVCWLHIFLLLIYSDHDRMTFWETFGWTEGMSFNTGGTVGDCLV